MYTDRNFMTKKALKNAIAAGEQIRVYQPNDMFGSTIPHDGTVAIEGPHYPRPHTWYASVTLTGGVITKVK